MKTKCLAAAFVILAVLGSSVFAQTLSPDAPYQALLHRLDQQERRIQELESTRRLPSTDQAETPGGRYFSASHQTPSLTADERLRQIETGLDEQAGALDDLQKSLKGFIKPGHGDMTMKIFGRIDIDAWGFPGDSPGVNAFETGDVNNDPQNTFQFRRMRLGASGNLSSNMIYKVSFEFAGGNKTEFRDAYLGWNDLPLLRTLLIGNQKRPYGLDHMNSSRFNVFMERPYVIESINQDSRRLGIASYGVSEDLVHNWRFGVYNMRLIQDEGKYRGDSPQIEVAGRYASTIWYDESSNGRGYAHLAIAGTVAHPDGSAGSGVSGVGPFANEARFRHRPEARSASRWIDTGVINGASYYELLASEAVLNVGRMQIVGEWQNLFLQRDNGTGDDLFFTGGYAYVSYFLTGEHMPWNRKTGTLGRIVPFENFFLVNRSGGGVGRGIGAWQVAARYSYADFTDNDIFGGVGESLTVGLNWYWTPYSRMQFNYIHGMVRERLTSTGPNTQAVVRGDYDIVGVRFRVDY